MAHPFFGFDTSLKEQIGLKIPLPDDDDDDGYTNEEEYDALNDETFGACDPTDLDDWEEQHEQLAEINESSRNSDKLESTLANLSFNEGTNSSFNNNKISSVWAYTPTTKTNSTCSNSGTILSSLQEASKSFIQSCQGNSTPNLNHNNAIENNIRSSFNTPNQQICTVEELEKNLLHTGQTPIEEHQKLSKQLTPIRVQPLQQQQQQNQLAPSNLQPRPLLPLQPTAQPPPPPSSAAAAGQPLPHPQFYRMMHPPNVHMSQPPPNLPPINIPPPPPPGVRFLPPPPMLRPYRIMPPHMHGIPPPQPPPNGIHRPPNFMYQMPPNSSFPCRPSPSQTRPMASVPYNHQQHMMYHPHHQSNAYMQQQQHQQSSQNHNHIQVNHHAQQQLHSYLPQNHPPPLAHQQRLTTHSNKQIQNMRNDIDDHYKVTKKSNKDEYAGLMTPRDIQWLLNIQMIQLNTGTPYFDDYYYTIYKHRHLSEKKENAQNKTSNDKDGKRKTQVKTGNSGGGRQRKISEKENTPKCHRTYTPMQFENSLGKLQCLSVTAPRKLIDMELVQHEKDQDNVHPSKDSRKIKQLLLELEGLYTLMLKAEDIKNPMYIDNKEKMIEIKQKQWLRELDQATTTEQKQQVLKNFVLESEPSTENSADYINKVINGFLQEEKFVGFLNIRKGKMLLLRLLPELYININTYKNQLQEVWTKVLLSLPIVGRRDTASDNILPSFYRYFKVYILACSMCDIIDLISGLLEVVKSDSNRSTPLSHLGKVPLFFVVLNKFGVSVLSSLLVRCENLYHKGFLISEMQHNEWSLFLKSWSRQSDSVLKVATPIESIPLDCFERHSARFPDLTPYDWDVLKKCYVDN